MSTAALVLRYGAFAIVATACNLATQRMMLAAADGMIGYSMALIAGTCVGLVVKYRLDRRWIFGAPSPTRGHGRDFSLYTFTGVATTAIFWGTETLFWLCWHSQAARETGAIVGLSIGYFVKYRLDRRYVFAGGNRRADKTA